MELTLLAREIVSLKTKSTWACNSNRLSRMRLDTELISTAFVLLGYLTFKVLGKLRGVSLSPDSISKFCISGKLSNIFFYF